MAASTGSLGVLDRKVERSEEAGAEPAICRVGHGPDDGKHAIELRHAYLAFDHGDAVLSGFLRMVESGDGAAEQRSGDMSPSIGSIPLSVQF